MTPRTALWLLSLIGAATLASGCAPPTAPLWQQVLAIIVAGLIHGYIESEAFKRREE